jgi:hypothetical protein
VAPVSDFAEDLFGDLAPEDEYYPGSKRKRSVRVTPPSEPDTEKPWDRSPRVLTVKGVETEFFTVGALAEAINRRPVTIRSWEQKGIIPKARYRTGGEMPRRLYTRAQVEGMIALCAKHRILHFAARPDAIPQAFTADVIELWRVQE